VDAFLPQCDVPNADLPERIKNLKTAAPLAAMLSALIRKLPVLSGIPNGKKLYKSCDIPALEVLREAGRLTPCPYGYMD